jgi:hypothetical protein
MLGAVLGLLLAVAPDGGSVGAMDEGASAGPPQVEEGPAAVAPKPPAAVRGYFLFSPGMMATFPSTGQANFRDFSGEGGFVNGVGQRTTPQFWLPLLVDVEVGLTIIERIRVAVGGVPLNQLLGHVGAVLGPVTLWLGGGYEQLMMVADGPHLYGPVASVRATLELQWGWFIFRPEVFGRMQLVTRYDEENGGEGRYMTFPSPLPTFQLGAKLGIGFGAPP